MPTITSNSIPMAKDHNIAAVVVPIVVTLVAVSLALLLGIFLCVRCRKKLWLRQSLSKDNEVAINTYQYSRIHDGMAIQYILWHNNIIERCVR